MVSLVYYFSETLRNRSNILEKLKKQISRGIPIIGAGAGTGISAKFEEEGGADLIVIYNSGRFRMAGRGSLAGLMPFKDANAVVLEMASEVLPVSSITKQCSVKLGNRVILLTSWDFHWELVPYDFSNRNKIAYFLVILSKQCTFFCGCCKGGEKGSSAGRRMCI